MQTKSMVENKTTERSDVMDFKDRNALPEGLGFSLALDVTAMTNFVNLPDSKKEELVNYIKCSTTGDEAKSRVKEVMYQLHCS